MNQTQKSSSFEINVSIRIIVARSKNLTRFTEPNGEYTKKKANWKWVKLKLTLWGEPVDRWSMLPIVAKFLIFGSSIYYFKVDFQKKEKETKFDFVFHPIYLTLSMRWYESENSKLLLSIKTYIKIHNEWRWIGSIVSQNLIPLVRSYENVTKQIEPNYYYNSFNKIKNKKTICSSVWLKERQTPAHSMQSYDSWQSDVLWSIPNCILFCNNSWSWRDFKLIHQSDCETDWLNCWLSAWIAYKFESIE